MNKIESIEREVRQLTTNELAGFRKWFQEFDAEAWDAQIERDVKVGGLEKLSRRSLKDHKAGKSSLL